jgi:hypothetical protein
LNIYSEDHLADIRPAIPFGIDVAKNAFINLDMLQLQTPWDTSTCKRRRPVRIYECSNCGLILDRDHNAALNILKLGSERTLVEKEPLLQEQASKFLR